MEDTLSEVVRRRVASRGWIVPTGAEPFDRGGGASVYHCYALRLVELMTRTVGEHRSMTRDDLESAATSIVSALLDERKRRGGLAVLKVAREPEERMQREIDVMTSIDNPRIVRARAWDDSSPPQWFVMDYFPRGTLHDHLREYHGQPERAVRALLPIAKLLGELHAKGLAHRDVKTKNLFVGDDGHLLLGDFGIAHDEAGTSQTTYETPRSRDWMPPWPDDDLQPPQQDVYMLVRVLYAMVSGEKRFEPGWFDHARYDLLSLFPNERRMKSVVAFLRRHITGTAAECASANGTELAEHMTTLLDDMAAPPESVRLLFSWALPANANAVAGDNAYLTYIPVLLQAGCTRVVARVRGYQSVGHSGCSLEVSEDGGGAVRAQSKRVEVPINAWSAPMEAQLDEAPREPTWMRLSFRSGETGSLAGVVAYAW